MPQRGKYVCTEYMKYIVWIVTPIDYSHNRALAEVGECLCAALEDLGHDAALVAQPDSRSGRMIVLGAHLLNGIAVPAGSIIYNFEQIFEGSPWFGTGYKKLLWENEVWDYCRSNVAALEKMGIRAKYVPVGYHPCLTRIENSAAPDIDVLHIGSLNARRSEILCTLQDRGLRVKQLFDSYGENRDRWIARAGIVLNMHFYDSRLFEIVRCSYLFANKKLVVSELGNDMELEGKFYEGAWFAPYEGLVNACMGALWNRDKRERITSKGFEIFSGLSQADYLKEAL